MSLVRGCVRGYVRAPARRLRPPDAGRDADACRAARSRDAAPGPLRRRRAPTGARGVRKRRVAKDDGRDAFGLRLLDELRGDIAYAVRLLRRSPAFTAVALVSLALGVGANTAIFSLVDIVLLKSLPVDDPQRLVFVDTSGGRSGGTNGPPYPCSSYSGHHRFLSGVAAFGETRFKSHDRRRRGTAPGPVRLRQLLRAARHSRGAWTTADAVRRFDFGRGGADGTVAVISYSLWQQRFGLDPAVLGKTILVGRTG